MNSFRTAAPARPSPPTLPMGFARPIAALTGASGEAMGQAARALVAVRFDIERVPDEYEALYARILRAR